ncbi:hypothetical protein GCM10009414_33400 [Tatumella terrea]
MPGIQWIAVCGRARNLHDDGGALGRRLLRSIAGGKVIKCPDDQATGGVPASGNPRCWNLAVPPVSLVFLRGWIARLPLSRELFGKKK